LKKRRDGLYHDTFRDAVRNIGDTENEQCFNGRGRKGRTLKAKALIREKYS
tara:strand:- start:226 stop:378 length:153 start_codon:yes stop_codon:yes gene_type:complete